MEPSAGLSPWAADRCLCSSSDLPKAQRPLELGAVMVWQRDRQALAGQGSCSPLAPWVGVTFQQLAQQPQERRACRAG